MMDSVKIDNIYGYIELKEHYAKEDGRLCCYSWSIKYDRDGKEINRTKPEKISELWWD